MLINFNNDYNIRSQVNTSNSVTESNNKKGEMTRSINESGLLVSLGQNTNISGNYDKDFEEKTTDWAKQIGATDVQLKQDYMSVMSLSMSDADYAEMVRTGQPPEDMDVTDSVTILDEIKASIIKGGTQVAGYTDNIDKAVLEEITGSVALANQLISSMHSQDVPVNERTVSDASAAINQAQAMLPINDKTTAILVENNMAPTIENISQASHTPDQAKWMNRPVTQAEVDELMPQIESVVKESGIDDYTKAVNEAKWLVERNLPLTKSSLLQLDSMEPLRDGLSREEITNSVAIAMGAGIPANKANLLYQESIYTQAEEINAKYQNMSEDEMVQSNNLHARQILEEVRISMTVEANRLLLRSNFQIDIAPMEELVDALKQARQVIGNRLFPGEDEAVANSKAQDYFETKKEIQEIPALPAAILGESFADGRSIFDREGAGYTLHQVYETGVSRRDMYLKAEQSYEALMTAPRVDLGDSIKKAFQNVDDILRDMGMDLSDDNRRAVRILGYNSMEISTENIEQIRDADNNLRKTLQKLTPSRVLNMIREDKNPLEMTVAELNDYLDSNENGRGEQASEYARFLMQLERHGEISEEERTSYIGIYRLLHKLEKTDDAAIGKLSQMGSEISFENILTAMRTTERGGMDYTVDDSFAGVDDIKRVMAIDDQINAAFTTGRFEEAAGVSERVIDNLLNSGANVSLNNVEAMNALKYKRGDWFKPIADEYLKGLVTKNPQDEVDEVVGEYVDVRTIPEKYNAMLDQYSDKLSDMLSSAKTLIDVKAIHSSMTQLSLLTTLARDEVYDFPAIIDGEATSIRLTVKHEEGAGEVSVSLNTDSLGSIVAQFSFAGKLDGYIAYETDTAGQRLTDAMESIKEKLGFEPGLIRGEKIDLAKYTDGFNKKKDNFHKEKEDSSDINNTELYRVAKLFIGVARTI